MKPKVIQADFWTTKSLTKTLEGVLTMSHYSMVSETCFRAGRMETQDNADPFSCPSASLHHSPSVLNSLLILSL